AIGESRSKRVNVRVISATNQNLAQMVEQKKFREDLYYRLSVLLLSVPPLRERREDIPLLIEYFLGRFSNNNGSKKLSTEAMKWLVSRDWPGNIRELKNVLERAVLLTSGHEVQKDDLFLPMDSADAIPRGPFRQAKKDYLQSFEKNYLQN